jgi:hypothetical protein
MQKRTIIKKIQNIIREWGAFGSGEVEGSLGETYSPCVNTMGGLVALAEYFKESEVDVNVYNPNSVSSDPIHDYTVSYEDLPKDVLLEILELCEQYDVIQEKTEKRISN